MPRAMQIPPCLQWRAASRGEAVVEEKGRRKVLKLMGEAQRGLRRGQAAAPHEREALGAWIAGDLPWVKFTDQSKGMQVTKAVVGAIRVTQQAAGEAYEAWREGGARERKRRTDREGGPEGRRWRGVGSWKFSRDSAPSRPCGANTGMPVS